MALTDEPALKLIQALFSRQGGPHMARDSSGLPKQLALFQRDRSLSASISCLIAPSSAFPA